MTVGSHKVSLMETAKNTVGTDASNRNDQRGGPKNAASPIKSTTEVLDQIELAFSEQKII